MFGDDPDSTVMTARSGLGEVSDTRARGLRAGKRGEVVGQEGNENTVGLGTVNESKE